MDLVLGAVGATIKMRFIFVSYTCTIQHKYAYAAEQKRNRINSKGL